MALNLPAAATPPIMPVGGNDPLQQLRLSGIFGQGTPPNQPQPGGMTGPVNEMSELSPPGMDMGGYDPSYQAAEAFQKLLEAFPTEGRGILEKIALSMLGAKDPRLAASISTSPTSAQQDWTSQIRPAQAAMSQEASTNRNLRILADNLTRSGQAEKRLGQGDIRLEQAGTRLEETGRHNQATEELAKWKSEHPNYQLKTREDGMIVGINPRNPQDVQETGVDSGRLSDQQKLDAGIEAAKTAETGRVGRQGTGITATQENIQERERLFRDRPPSARSGGAQELELRRGISNRAQKAVAENPEWAEFINIDGDRVTLQGPKPSGMLRGFFQGGPDQATYDAMFKAIYGDEAATTSDDTGTVQVLDPDGNPGTIPTSELETALAAGYTRAP